MIAFLMYVLSALMLIVGFAGIYSIFDAQYKATNFPTVDSDLFWFGLFVGVVFGVLGRILSKLDAIEKRMNPDGSVTRIKARKDLGNWPPSV